MYSWTGRGVYKQNLEFRKLTNILSIFYEVICYADCTFSHKQKEYFFRDCVLKHSEQRSQPKEARLPSAKKKKITPEAVATVTNYNYDLNEIGAQVINEVNIVDVKSIDVDQIATCLVTEYENHEYLNDE